MESSGVRRVARNRAEMLSCEIGGREEKRKGSEGGEERRKEGDREERQNGEKRRRELRRSTVVAPGISLSLPLSLSHYL